MDNIRRKDLEMVSSHSNLSEEVANRVLREKIYPGKNDWKKFLELFFLTLGIGFAVAGTFFFFAYNWANLHKFAKIGIVEGILVVAVALALYARISLLFRNIMLMAAAIIVGLLLAVFGQVYQTGAEAYDFFLTWTLCVSVWALISNFPPLWLFYLFLINSTLVLYASQVAMDWPNLRIYLWLFCLNSLVLISSILLVRFKIKASYPTWYLNILALASVTIASLGIMDGITEFYPEGLWVLLILVTGAYGFGIWYGVRERKSFYLAIIPFSVIAVISSWLLHLSHQEGMWLFVCLFILSAVTVVIKNLLDFQKKWSNEK